MQLPAQNIPGGSTQTNEIIYEFVFDKNVRKTCILPATLTELPFHGHSKLKVLISTSYWNPGTFAEL